MALSNKERVGRVLEALKDGLGPFILREYRLVYTRKGYVNEIDATLATPGHSGLVFRGLGQVYFDDHSLLVHPDHVVEPPEVKLPEISVVKEGPDVGEPTGELKPVKKVLSRYYGRVEIDPQRVNKDMGLIVEEVIQRLTSQLGCEVEITLEISARRPEGFDESTVRTISENSRTLKFVGYGFEEG